MEIEDVRKNIRIGNYRLTIHAFERCVERDISPDEVEYVILNGEIIEEAYDPTLDPDEWESDFKKRRKRT
ncbi:MAG: DUF4258 domain-containing protein [Pseudomonadota bacterium]